LLVQVNIDNKDILCAWYSHLITDSNAMCLTVSVCFFSFLSQIWKIQRIFDDDDQQQQQQQQQQNECSDGSYLFINRKYAYIHFMTEISILVKVKMIPILFESSYTPSLTNDWNTDPILEIF
jgi:low temperature requirement protein LtrA